MLFGSIHSSAFARIVLLILLGVSFIMLDIVYVAVTVNYCVQCALLIVYTASLQQKIREKVYDLRQSAKVRSCEICLMIKGPCHIVTFILDKNIVLK